MRMKAQAVRLMKWQSLGRSCSKVVFPAFAILRPITQSWGRVFDLDTACQATRRALCFEQLEELCVWSSISYLQSHPLAMVPRTWSIACQMSWYPVTPWLIATCPESAHT